MTMIDSKIMLSVVMITYNHEEYIKEAIESVLMQECDYEVELIIADDKSPDNTESVVLDIIKNHKNGHWIKYTKHKTNKGMMPNFVWALEQCKGKCVALCEGDDYWIDPLKLQKQVEFLEENEGYSTSAHDVKIIYDKSWKGNKGIRFNKAIDKVTCINIHPGYNPINRGWYPQVFAIINDLEIGATIHEIDEEIDHGRIIARAKVNKYEYDTSLTLYNRVIDKEIELLKENFGKILKKQYLSFKPEKQGQLYLKKDFNELCKLDLNEKLTMGEALKKMRALTHGKYENAFYIDEHQNKIYISVNISKLQNGQ